MKKCFVKLGKVPTCDVYFTYYRVCAIKIFIYFFFCNGIKHVPLKISSRSPVKTSENGMKRK